MAAGLAALAAVTTFAVRAAPTGGVAWLQLVSGIVVAVALGGLLVYLRGIRRVHAAGVVGAIAAAVSISSLPVFWHGVVVSALPAPGARLACALALVCGVAAAALSFLPEPERVRREAAVILLAAAARRSAATRRSCRSRSGRGRATARPRSSRDGRPVGTLTCGPAGKTFRVHLELFAQRKVVVVPPGIGVARSGCVYPARTLAPTGIVEVEPGAKLRLGDLFRIWGRRLGPRALLSFRSGSPVRAYVAGKRFAGRRGRRAAHAGRADRGRDRRLRPAARDASCSPAARGGRVIRRLAPLLVLALVLAGCGGGSSGPDFPTIGAARTFQLANFEPAGPVQPGKPTTISFVIRQPDGQPLTQFKRGAGPHTGVHLIFVRDDLGDDHPQAPAGRGRRHDPRDGHVPGAPAATGSSSTPTRPPASSRTSSCSRRSRVAGTATPEPLPPPAQVVESDGYRFAIAGQAEAEGDPGGVAHHRRHRPAGPARAFTPYFGALAHAIFFRRGTLDYFHTHVCAPGASGCTSTLGGAQVTGRSTKPGRLRSACSFPAPGTWRLFLQTKIGGRVVTAPFTLDVK